MTRWQITALFAIVGLILAGAYFWPVSGAPLTGSQCYTQDELEKDSLEAGGIIAGAAYYNGVNSDTVIMIQGKKEILAVLFKDGCFVGIEGVDLTAVGKGDPA